MNIFSRKSAILLFVGDILSFFISLWITLIIRYQSGLSAKIFSDHLVPFSLLFIVWYVVFFIAGLYERRVVIIKDNLPKIIVKSQIANSIIAIIFFYFIPYFGITPKTNLFIYLIVSLVIVLVWRIYFYPLFQSKKHYRALLIARGNELNELRDEINTHHHYNFSLVSSVNLDKVDTLNFQEEILNRIHREDVSIIILDLEDSKIKPILPKLYNLIFSNIMFIDIHKMYEDVFGRIPLSLVHHNWFLENVSTSPKITYDILKRLMDIVLGFLIGISSLFLYPIVYVAIKLDDGGAIFSFQKRIGRNNRIINIMKFRTMSVANDEGKWGTKVNTVTRVGAFLRRTRIDELPQVWNVVKGDISLIGPRPEFPDPVKEYSAEIPYYNVRHIIKPGLSGWAQIYGEHPHHGVDVDKTANKLSYDLYYVKNRSFALDVKIALKTVKTLLSQSGL